MCNCRTMVRLPDIETQDGRYPMPEHAPNCEDFKLHTFARVTLDGVSCVMKKEEAQRMTFDDDSEYEITDIFLTQDQFDNMEDFGGF